MPEIEGWKEHQERLDILEAKLAEEKKINDEKKKIEDIKRKEKEAIEAEARKIKEEQEKIAKTQRIRRDFILLIAGMEIGKDLRLKKANQAK